MTRNSQKYIKNNDFLIFYFFGRIFKIFYSCFGVPGVEYRFWPVQKMQNFISNWMESMKIARIAKTWWKNAKNWSEKSWKMFGKSTQSKKIKNSKFVQKIMLTPLLVNILTSGIDWEGSRGLKILIFAFFEENACFGQFWTMFWE